MTQSHPLNLPDVTLCCVDTRSVPLALASMRRCMELVNFGQALFLGPDHGASGITVPEGIRWITIPTLQGIEDYNRVMLRELVDCVNTTHVLVIQWDGFIVDSTRWSDDFLNWDYIGAPWYDRHNVGKVGNGGFSLRSHKLLRGLKEINVDFQRPEDVEICVHHYALLAERYDIKIAPLSLAQEFSCEYGDYRPTFGFHGMHNFTHIFDEPTLTAWLASAPAEIITHKHARNLVKSLMVNRRASEAMQLLQLRSHHLGWSYDQCQLLLRACAHRFRTCGL